MESLTTVLASIAYLYGSTALQQPGVQSLFDYGSALGREDLASLSKRNLTNLAWACQVIFFEVRTVYSHIPAMSL